MNRPKSALPLRLAVASLIGFAVVSSIDPPTKNLDRCLEPDEVDLSIDYFPDKVSPDDSAGWFITYHNYYKILTNRRAEKSYVLHQCGTDPPPSSEVGGSDEHHLFLSVPLQGGVVLTQTTQIPHMELLNLRREIRAFVGDNSTVSSPCLNFLLESGDVVNLFDEADPYNVTRIDQLISEYLRDQNPDAVVFEGPYGSHDGERRFAVSESQESSSPAVFEWHEYIAALYNLEAMAQETVERTAKRHDCVRANAGILTSDSPSSTLSGINNGTNDTTKVIWSWYYGEVGGWDVAECPNYYCEYASDCDVTLLARPDNVGSIVASWGVYLTDEEFVNFGMDADVWIYAAADFDAMYGEKKDLLDTMKAVRQKKVYDYQGRGSSSWFEQRLAEYDIVLLDFCSIAGTASPNSLHRRQYFRNVFTEPVGEPGTCTADDIDVPFVSSAPDCELLTETATTSSVDGSSPASFALLSHSSSSVFGRFFVFVSVAIWIMTI